MTIKSTGRRGLFGLLAGAPLAGFTVPAPASAIGSIGERGPEAIIPLQRDARGCIGLDGIVEAAERSIAGRIARGEGNLGRAIEGVYGLDRRGR